MLAAALTHGHSLGFIPAAALVHIVAKCMLSEDSLEDIVKDAIDTMCELFEKDIYIDEFCKIMQLAIELSYQKLSDLEAIRKIGEGWVGEEALAIAVYCALKYQNDFRKAIIASVNHDGDSDSTGAVTGNILGAYLGVSQIPNEWIEPLELKEVMEELIMDMYEDCQMSKESDSYNEIWYKKYVM